MQRITLHVNLYPEDNGSRDEAGGETSETVRKRVEEARQFRAALRESNPRISAEHSALLRGTLQPGAAEDHQFLNVIAIARTIADLELSEMVRTEHVEEALSHVMLIRKQPTEPDVTQTKKPDAPARRPTEEASRQIPMAFY